MNKAELTTYAAQAVGGVVVVIGLGLIERALPLIVILIGVGAVLAGGIYRRKLVEKG